MMCISAREIERWSPTLWHEIAGNSDLINMFWDFIVNSPCNTLVTGSKRTGKTRTIILGIMALVCVRRVNGVDPCGKCDACRSVASGDSHMGLHQAIEGNKYCYIRKDCNKWTAQEIRNFREEISFNDVPTIVHLDEVAALGLDGRDELLVTAVDEWDCIWFASATTVKKKKKKGIRKCKGLTPTLRARFTRKISTNLPTNEELTNWILQRCEEWKITVEQPKNTIPKLIKRSGSRVGHVKQPIVMAATKGRLLTLEDVQGFDFDSLD